VAFAETSSQQTILVTDRDFAALKYLESVVGIGPMRSSSIFGSSSERMAGKQEVGQNRLLGDYFPEPTSGELHGSPTAKPRTT